MYGLARPIAVEAYGLFIFRDCIEATGGSSTPIGFDGEGAVVSDLENLDTSAALITPAHHFPTGCRCTPPGVPRWWTGRGAPTPMSSKTTTTASSDTTVNPSARYRASIRIAWCTWVRRARAWHRHCVWAGWCSPEQMDAAVAATGGAQWYVGAISQLTMADFIAGGHYDRHIRRMRGRYRRRRNLLVQRLAGYNVGVRGLSAGLHLLLTLPEGTESDVLYRAGEAGWRSPGWLGCAIHWPVRTSPIRTAWWSASAPRPITVLARPSTRFAACWRPPDSNRAMAPSGSAMPRHGSRSRRCSRHANLRIRRRPHPVPR